MLARFVCWLRGRGHRPVRNPALSGFRCEDCGKTGADLGAFGDVDSGYVGSLRRTYNRDTGSFVRSHSWEDTPGKESR